MRKSGGNVFSLYEKVGRKRLERHWKSGGNVLECDRKSDGTVPLLNFIFKNIVFEKISEKKHFFFEKISESCFFVFSKNLRKKIFFWSNIFSRHTQKRRHHSHTKQVSSCWGCHVSQILAEIHRVQTFGDTHTYVICRG